MTSQDLENFKNLLKDEYEKRIKEYEKKIEEELAEIAASRALELEKKAEEIKRYRLKQLQERLDLIKLKAVKAGKDVIANAASEVYRDIKEMAEKITYDARANSANYGLMLSNLIEEALEVLSCEGGVIWLLPEEESFIKPPRGFKLTIAQRGDSWGGPIVTDEEEERVVENTVRGRFERLAPIILQRIGSVMSPIMEKIYRS